MSRVDWDWYEDLIASGRVRVGECKLCSEQFIDQFEYNHLGICDDCACKIVNAFSMSHSGAPHPVVDPQGYREHLEETSRKVYSKQPIPEALRWEVFQRDNFTCKHCGARDHLRADHVIPERKCGPTTLENLQTLCRRCNSRKGDRA